MRPTAAPELPPHCVQASAHLAADQPDVQAQPQAQGQADAAGAVRTWDAAAVSVEAAHAAHAGRGLALAQGCFPAVLVQVLATQGSAPRAAGAWMLVGATQQWGTIGGGQLEHSAVQLARARMAMNGPALQAAGDAAPHWPFEQRWALGPSMGQCCGGVVRLGFDWVPNASHLGWQRLSSPPPKATVAVFGAGHVGQALLRLLSSLPVQLQWVDSRERVGDEPVQHVRVCGWGVQTSEAPQDAVPDLPAGAAVVILTHSHHQDFEVLRACLLRQRQDAGWAYLGLIGSQSKWASFSRRLRDQGFTGEELASVTCPIGVPGIRSKRPEVLALAVAAQLAQHLDAQLR